LASAPWVVVILRIPFVERDFYDETH